MDVKGIFYVKENAENDITDWYTLLPLHMRVLDTWYKTQKEHTEKKHLRFYLTEDRIVTESDLGRILEMVYNVIEEWAPKSEREEKKQRYIDIIRGVKSHSELAEITSFFCSELLPQD